MTAYSVAARKTATRVTRPRSTKTSRRDTGPQKRTKAGKHSSPGQITIPGTSCGNATTGTVETTKRPSSSSKVTDRVVIRTLATTTLSRLRGSIRIAKTTLATRGKRHKRHGTVWVGDGLETFTFAKPVSNNIH